MTQLSREQMREYMREYRASHPDYAKKIDSRKPRLRKKLKYMREYYHKNYERLFPAAVLRVKEWRERKNRQAVAIDEFLDAFDGFEYARRCAEMHAETRERRQWRRIPVVRRGRPGRGAHDMSAR
jgi:hypothetical protein